MSRPDPDQPEAEPEPEAELAEGAKAKDAHERWLLDQRPPHWD